MRLLRYNQQPFSLMFTPHILSHEQIHRRITSAHKKRCTDKQKSYSEHWLDYVNYISIELHYPAFEISADTCCKKKPQIRYITTLFFYHIRCKNISCKASPPSIAATYPQAEGRLSYRKKRQTYKKQNIHHRTSYPCRHSRKNVFQEIFYAKHNTNKRCPQHCVSAVAIPKPSLQAQTVSMPKGKRCLYFLHIGL